MTDHTQMYLDHTAVLALIAERDALRAEVARLEGREATLQYLCMGVLGQGDLLPADAAQAVITLMAEMWHERKARGDVAGPREVELQLDRVALRAALQAAAVALTNVIPAARWESCTYKASGDPTTHCCTWTELTDQAEAALAGLRAVAGAPEGGTDEST